MYQRAMYPASVPCLTWQIRISKLSQCLYCFITITKIYRTFFRLVLNSNLRCLKVMCFVFVFVFCLFVCLFVCFLFCFIFVFVLVFCLFVLFCFVFVCFDFDFDFDFFFFFFFLLLVFLHIRTAQLNISTFS